jgi:hypothetical protein
MLYRVLADATVLVHFLWILFLILGGLWGRRLRAVRVLHFIGLVFALAIQVLDWYCPLTHLEVWLRSRQDPAGAYAESFIVHYVERIIYMEVSRTLVFALTVLLFGFNIWLYAGRPGPARKSPRPGSPA